MAGEKKVARSKNTKQSASIRVDLRFRRGGESGTPYFIRRRSAAESMSFRAPCFVLLTPCYGLLSPGTILPMPKVALAYSGSLDTTICVHYLRHVKGMKAYTFSANLGQPEYLEPLAEQAVDMGATAASHGRQPMLFMIASNSVRPQMTGRGSGVGCKSPTVLSR